MPAGDALATPDMKKYLSQYAGQAMTTGAQAKAYADHYILGHMNEASGGKSYARGQLRGDGRGQDRPDAQATNDLPEPQGHAVPGQRPAQHAARPPTPSGPSA